jgi:transcriptional regulator with XRE-family HTH domain
MRQEDACLLGGVTRAMWGRYERGLAMPSSEVLLKVQGHGFDVNFVLGGVRMLTDATLSDDERQLLHNYRFTDDDGRAALLRMSGLEAQRAVSAPAGAYPPGPATRPLLLHDPKPAARKPRS